MKTITLLTLMLSYNSFGLTLAKETPSEFSALKNQFDKAYGTKTRSKFEVFYSNKKVLGYCTEKNTIQINLKYWRKLNGMDKEWLVFHELGHCVLGLDHNDELNVDGYPKSIMYPVMFSELKYYNSHRLEYIDELRIENAKTDKHVNVNECNDVILMLREKESGI